MHTYKNILLSFLFIFCSCVIRPTFIPQMPTVQKVEQQLPTDPANLQLPAEVAASGNWVVALEAGACNAAPATPTPMPTQNKLCPAQSGIFESEAHAAKDQQYRISYDELRKLYTADKNIWVVQQELYETTLKQQQEQLVKLQPTWFQQNAFSLGLAGGFVFGTLLIGATIVLTK